MDVPPRPRAFISYRHIEHETGADQEARNAAHRQWVETFAADLAKYRVDTVFDGQLREIFRPYTALDPFMVPFLAEVSAICSLICHAFIPILTPSYIERLGYGNYAPQQETKLSFVQEEWQFAMFYANAGVMQYIPIVRAGEPERMAALPLGVSPDNAFDMRDPAHYPHQVRFIAERIHAAWDGDHALIKLGLEDWVMTYIAWCRENYPGCAETRVDAWQIDLVRPRLFLDRVFQASAGPQAQSPPVRGPRAVRPPAVERLASSTCTRVGFNRAVTIPCRIFCPRRPHSVEAASSAKTPCQSFNLSNALIFQLK